MPSADAFRQQETLLHGHRIGFRTVGHGPALVLIHGMLNSSRHWRDVALELAATHTVIAPDLHGHGGSAGPEGDYSLGAHAAGIRDLLSALGYDRATIAGHSLGGGVAMQFFYQFPERTERLILISSGGLGREVSWPLRVAAAPGIEGVLGAATGRTVLRTLDRLARALRARDHQLGVYVAAAHQALAGLDTPEARRGFLWTLRSVINLRGQRVSAHDRLYLAGAVPTLLVWGGRDNTIPVAHGVAAQRAIPNSRLEILDGAAHFPHLEDPRALARAIGAFVAATEPAALNQDDWRRLVRARITGARKGAGGLSARAAPPARASR